MKTFSPIVGFVCSIFAYYTSNSIVLRLFFLLGLTFKKSCQCFPSLLNIPSFNGLTFGYFYLNIYYYLCVQSLLQVLYSPLVGIPGLQSQWLRITIDSIYSDLFNLFVIAYFSISP